jgi:hypothetical protein
MSVDTEFVHDFVGFLNGAFPADLSAEEMVGRADIIVYGLANKLWPLTGTKVTFLDWASQGRSGGGGPHLPQGAVAEGRPGGGGPHLLQAKGAVEEGRPGGAGPHLLQNEGAAEEGRPGGAGPQRRLENLVVYAADVSSPELANAYRNHPVTR